MATPITGQSQPGIPIAAQKTGAPAVLPTGWSNELLISPILAKYSHLTQAGVVYSTGMQLTSISNATFTTATGLSATLATAATATPIVGIWNPTTSGVNAHILLADLAVVITALQAGGCGGFVWAAYQNQSNITVAGQAVPVNRKTLLGQGSQIKGLSGLALTGLGSTGLFLGASGLNGGAAINASTLQTAAGFETIATSGFEVIDGCIIVPPGGILALFCSTTPVAHSAVASLTWAEMPA